MHPNWVVPNNNPHPQFFFGILLAIACGVLGGLLWVYFRDIARGDSQPARKPDGFIPPSFQNTKPLNHSSGGCVELVLCLVLGSTAILLMGNASQFKDFLQAIHDTDIAYYYPDRNPQKVAENSEPNEEELYFGVRPPSNANWTDNKWTADDAPYLKIRREVDAGIANGSITKYKSSEVHDGKYWREHPKVNPGNTFRNAYVGYALSYHKWYHFHSSEKPVTWRERYRYDERRRDLVEHDVYDAILSMKSAENPHSYQYSRLLFLLESFESVDLDVGGSGLTDAPDLTIEGKNLLAHRSQDWEVKLMLAKLMDQYYHTYLNYRDSNNQVLKYVQEVVAAKPQWPQAWETLGVAYESLNSKSTVTKTEQKKNTAAALAAYRKCLQIAPKDYGPRITVEEEIHRIIAKQKSLTK